MHGAFAGAPSGSRNGAYWHGRFTKEARDVSKHFRELARDADVLTASLAQAAGLKPIRPLRRKAHVRRALQEMAKAKEGEKA
jgi:hypothetical protein